jgi:type IV pilus assembly protein PilX
MNGLYVFLNKQQGAALFVSLMMLILITILGVTGVRLVSLEEKMAGNSYDRNLAFQSAEAALIEAEQYIKEHKTVLTTTAVCTTTNHNVSEAINNCNEAGVCPIPHKDCYPRWTESAGFTEWVAVSEDLHENLQENLGEQLAGTSAQYFIEFLGYKDCPKDPTLVCKFYRITACSRPGAANPISNEVFCKRSTSGGRSNVLLQSIYYTD